METAPEQRVPRVGADRAAVGPPRRWRRVYAAILLHLGLWIGLLWAFSRFFGSPS